MLIEKYKQLRITSKVDSSSSGTKSKGRKSLGGEDKEISLAGGRFAFAHEPWVDPSTLDLKCPENVDPLSPRRYEEAHLRELAVIAELHASLPPSLRACLTNKDRRESFKSTVRHKDSFLLSDSNRSRRHTSSCTNSSKSGLT